MQEWRRVLAPSGTIYVSVPDLDVLASLLLQKNKLTYHERFNIIRMIFGGHVDEYDYHLGGFNQEILTRQLKMAGFTNIRKVKEFNIFKDTSCMTYKETLISLNMIAEK